MFKIFKTFKKNDKKMKEELEKLKELYGANIIEKIQSGESNLVLNLNEENLYKPFSNKSLLNEEIFAYLDPFFFIFKKLKKINIEVIFPPSISEEEKDKIIKMIKTRYIFEFEGSNKKIHQSRSRALICLIIGVILLTVNITFNLLFDNEILKEVIDIFAWVFIWEACDLYTFSSLNYSLEKARAIKFYDANYIFDKGEKNE